ncbi:MAG: 50S ribosomal protein L6, partial [Dorea sp.]|nr:50S ribosomal protein L6 [Dorea sp.]
GVGYRAEKKGDTLVLHLGYSHPIEMKDPEGITTELPSQTEIIIKGISKEQVGNYAAVIRKHRPPEPYKGKGIKYAGEVIIRKEGKSGAK